jgi:hypothetical protein
LRTVESARSRRTATTVPGPSSTLRGTGAAGASAVAALVVRLASGVGEPPHAAIVIEGTNIAANTDMFTGHLLEVQV